MMRNSARLSIAASLFAAVALAPMTAQAQTQNQSRCVSPSGSVEQRVCAVAAEGPEALRRFLFRTRSIYQVYFFDFVKPSA